MEKGRRIGVCSISPEKRTDTNFARAHKYPLEFNATNAGHLEWYKGKAIYEYFETQNFLTVSGEGAITQFERLVMIEAWEQYYFQYVLGLL
jgi:hypothetical protein